MENITKVENYSKGDAIQIMVSTNGKPINGKNQGLGWRTRQLGGYMSDSSLQHLAQGLLKVEEPIGQANLQQSALVAGQRNDPIEYHQWTEITPASTPCPPTSTA